MKEPTLPTATDPKVLTESAGDALWARWDYEEVFDAWEQLQHVAERFEAQVLAQRDRTRLGSSRTAPLEVTIARALSALLLLATADDVSAQRELDQWARAYLKNKGSLLDPRSECAVYMLRRLRHLLPQCDLYADGGCAALARRTEGMLRALGLLGNGNITPSGAERLATDLTEIVQRADDLARPISAERVVAHALRAFGIVASLDEGRNWLKSEKMRQRRRRR